MPAHKEHTKDFSDMEYSEQANYINSVMATCGKAIRGHIRKASLDKRDVNETRTKCIQQVRRLLVRVENL